MKLSVALNYSPQRNYYPRLEMQLSANTTADANSKSPNLRVWIRLALLGVWAVVFYGVLMVANMQTSLGHSLCGPWGCFPRVEALVAWHSGCLMILVPAVWFICRRFSSTAVGLALTAVGLIGAFFVGYRVFQQGGGSFSQPYLVQKVGMTILSTTDFPIVALLVSGVLTLLLSVVCWCLRTRPSTAERQGEVEAEST